MTSVYPTTSLSPPEHTETCSKAKTDSSFDRFRPKQNVHACSRPIRFSSAMVPAPMNPLEALDLCLDIDGCVGAALGDHSSGLTLGAVGGVEREMLDAAVAAATKTLRGTFKIVADMESADQVDDLIINVGDRIHIACPVPAQHNGPGLFLYAVFDSTVTGLGLARKHLRSLADGLLV